VQKAVHFHVGQFCARRQSLFSEYRGIIILLLSFIYYLCSTGESLVVFLSVDNIILFISCLKFFTVPGSVLSPPIPRWRRLGIFEPEVVIIK
jgi:hypothetical protein